MSCALGVQQQQLDLAPVPTVDCVHRPRLRVASAQLGKFFLVGVEDDRISALILGQQIVQRVELVGAELTREISY